MVKPTFETRNTDNSEIIYASILDRFLALVIDGILLVVLSFVLILLLGNYGIWLYYVALFAYFTYFEGTRGRTLGKELIGIKVVKENGVPCNLSAAFTRSVLRLIDAFTLYLVVFFTAKKQRIGDKAAKTIVIKAP